MESFILVVQVLTNLAVLTLCVFLVIFLRKLGGTLDSLEKNAREFSARALPIMDNLEVITDKARNIADNVDDQIELVKESINAVREIADDVVAFERKVQARIEEPVLETIGTIAAVLKGVRAFFVRLKA